jgi:hypothetical protein
MATQASHTPGRKGENDPTAQGSKDRDQGMAATAIDAVKGAAGATADAVSHAASAVGHTAKDAMAAVGDTLQSGARYLQERDWSGMLDEGTGLVRRHPLPALLVSVALGYCMGRLLRS